MASFDDYLKQIYGGQPPSMNYYYQLGATKRRNEEARKEAERRRREAEREAEKAQKKAEKEAEKEAENEALKALLEDVRGKSSTTSSPSSSSKSSSKKDDDKGGFFDNLLGLGKDVVGDVLHVGKTATKGLGELAKVAFTDYTMEDMRKAAKEQEKKNKKEFTPYSGEHSSSLSKEAYRATDRIMNSASFGMMEDARRRMDINPEPFEDRRGVGAAGDVLYDLIGSIAPGAAIVKGMQGTRLAANLTDDMTKLGRAGQRAKEGAAAGAIYSGADAAISEALDPNRRNMPEHLRNIALETLFGGVADPAIGGIFDMLGKGAIRAGASTPRRVRELASMIENPSAPNVMAPQTPPVPDINLGPSYRSIQPMTRPEIQVNRTAVPVEPEARIQLLDELLSQRDQLLGELDTRRNAFMDDFLNRYQSKLPPNNEREISDALANWDFHKTQAQQYKEIRKNVGKFTIPEHLTEDYRGLFPRSFIAAKGTPNVPDVFAAAEGMGLPGNDEGVRQLGQILRDMQQSTLVRKKDLVPEQEGVILTDQDKAGIRDIADTAFPETEDARAINPLLDALEQDINMLQDPNVASSFRVNTKAPEPRDPMADILAMRGPQAQSQAQAAPATQPPTRQLQQTPSLDESPIARADEDRLVDKIMSVPKKLKQAKDRFKYEFVSEYQPLKDIERQIAKMDTDNVLKRTPHGDIDIKDSFYKSLRNAGRSSRVAAESIERHYAPIIERLNKAGIKREDFEEYALARHAKDILDKNAEKAQQARQLVEEMQTTDPNSPRAKEIERELEKLDQYFLPKEATPEWVESTLSKYEGNEAMTEAQKQFVNEQRKDIITLQKAGVYSKKQAEAMLKEHPNYVSLRREIEEIADVKQRGTGSTPGRVGEPFKRRKQGSLDKVLPPLESAMQNRIRAIDTAMKNQALKKVENLLKVDGAENFFRPLKESDPYFKDRAKLTFKKDGKDVHYEVPDDIARMLTNMGTQGMDNPAFNAIEKLAVLSKKGMTHYNPTFLVKSPVRDTVNAIFTSRTGRTPLTFMTGFLDAVAGKQLNKLTGGKFKTYNDVFKELGGDFSSYISMDIKDLAQVQKAMQKGKVGKGLEVINPFKHLEAFGAAMERGPRLAEFRSAKKAGYSDEGALFEATDVIDYSDLGNTVKKLNKIAPYLGATLRGNIRVFQAFKERPVMATMRGIATITVPTVGIYSLRFHENVTDKQRAKIQNLPDWQKNMFWVVPDLEEGSDKLYMIPKGFLVSQIFANPVERALDQVYGEKKPDEKLMKETLKDFKDALMPPTSVAVISTISQIARNRDDFLGMPIESADMQKRPREDRYDASTSELAKVAGKVMNLSPAMIDFFVKQTTGGLGRDVLDLSDNLAHEAGVDRPAKTRTNTEILNPFSQFRYDDTGSSRYTDELYKANQKEASKKSEIRAEFKAETGMSMPSDDRGRSPVGEYYDAFRDINREIKQIREDKTLSSAQKKDMIAELRDEQRNLGVRLTDEGVLANQDEQLKETERYLNELGQDAKPTKGDLRDVLREQLLSRGHDRQKVEQVLRGLDKDQIVYLLEQMR